MTITWGLSWFTPLKYELWELSKIFVRRLGAIARAGYDCEMQKGTVVICAPGREEL